MERKCNHFCRLSPFTRLTDSDWYN